MQGPIKLQLFENQYIIDFIKSLNAKEPFPKEKLQKYYDFVKDYFPDELKSYIFSIFFQVYYEQFYGKRAFDNVSLENYRQFAENITEINKDLDPNVTELFEDFLRATNTILDANITKEMQTGVLLEYFEKSKCDNAIVNFLTLSYLYNILMLDTGAVLDYSEKILSLVSEWQIKYEKVISQLYLLGERYYKMRRIINGG